MLPILNEIILNRLKSCIPENVDFYKSDGVWVKDFLGIDHLPLHTNAILSTDVKNNEKLDYKNAVILHKSLSNLSPAEASDERIWVYLTHYTYWEYMRARWPIENTTGDQLNFIKTRYFFGERPYSRNGIARLWWFAHITYDSQNDDPYELTRIMLEDQDQDLARMVMETPVIARNKAALKVIIYSIQKFRKGNVQVKARDFIRFAAKYMNLSGSVTLWDSLSYDDLEGNINRVTEKWMESNKISVN